MVEQSGLIPSLADYPRDFLEKAQVALPALDRLVSIASRAPANDSEKWRVERARDFCACALATLEAKIPTETICRSWSMTADRILAEAFEQVQAESPLKGNLGLFAYGKLGARELNLSSDVDLLLVSDQEEENVNDWIRRFRARLQDVTDFGFCFRLDFDLRPGGRFGPLVPTLSQFEDYFYNYGEAWERLAFVRFRPVCGSNDLGALCLEKAHAFTYRKHLDFTLLEDLKSLRQRIHEQNWRRSGNGALDLKLGLGGIRDLELFVHTQQVIHGGRDPELRSPSTETALRELGTKKVLAEEDVDFLIRHYWSLRHAENLLQAATDRQIQILPADSHLELIPEGERRRIRADMQKCQDLVTGLLGPVDVSVRSLPESEEEQRHWLLGLGFSEKGIDRSWGALIKKSALSRQPERDELYRKRFLFEVCEGIGKHARNKDLSLDILGDFLRAIRAKATFFHLLLQNPELLERLALLFSSSSYLSHILIQRPELLDSFLYQALGAAPDAEWDQVLAYCLEKKLLTEMTAGLDFLNDRDLPSLLRKLSAIADEIVRTLIDKLNAEYGSNIDVLAMGKWGGLELGLRSDLDLVLITDEAPTEKDLKVARRLISRLTDIQKGGSLYELDFRLKPQGKGGPLLTTASELLRYLSDEAEPWERQAYLKARRLRRPGWEKQIHAACLSRPVTDVEWGRLEEIHQGLLQKAKSEVDLKYSPGGLVETEFVVQLRFLADRQAPRTTSMLESLKDLSSKERGWEKISNHYVSLRTYEQNLRLISTHQQSDFATESEQAHALASLEQTDFLELSRRIRSQLEENAALLGPLDPRPRKA